ncbi:MAG: site-specific integrase [Oscillospiraceae bacterium]|nr:site-specific integrase [Oscillospiraceae bacterium]
MGYGGTSAHSFRKWYATEIYRKNGYGIALVQRLLRHSYASTTQRYSRSALRRRLMDMRS